MQHGIAQFKAMIASDQSKPDQLVANATRSQTVSKSSSNHKPFESVLETHESTGPEDEVDSRANREDRSTKGTYASSTPTANDAEGHDVSKPDADGTEAVADGSLPPTSAFSSASPQGDRSSESPELAGSGSMPAQRIEDLGPTDRNASHIVGASAAAVPLRQLDGLGVMQQAQVSAVPAASNPRGKFEALTADTLASNRTTQSIPGGAASLVGRNADSQMHAVGAATPIESIRLGTIPSAAVISTDAGSVALAQESLGAGTTTAQYAAAQFMSLEQGVAQRRQATELTHLSSVSAPLQGEAKFFGSGAKDGDNAYGRHETAQSVTISERQGANTALISTSSPANQSHIATSHGALASTQTITASSSDPSTEMAQTHIDPTHVVESENELRMVALQDMQRTSESATQMRSAHGFEGRQAEITRQIAVQIWQQANERIGSLIELQLAPEELGALKFRMTLTETGYQILVQADRPETQDLMRRHYADLMAQFDAMGLGDATVSFGGSTSEDDTAEHGLSNDDLNMIAEDQALEPPTHHGLRLGVDMRV